MNVTTLMQYLSYALMAIGILAFIVSMVVQVVKEMPGLTNIQTNLIALVVSLILCPLAVIIACQYFAVKIVWYYLIGALVGAFIVYLVATGGWERVQEMWERTRYKKDDYSNGKR